MTRIRTKLVSLLAMLNSGFRGENLKSTMLLYVSTMALTSLFLLLIALLCGVNKSVDFIPLIAVAAVVFVTIAITIYCGRWALPSATGGVVGQKSELELIASTPQPHPIAEGVIPLPLNSHYNFDSFIVSPLNRPAYSAAELISALPGRIHNPLFIYGMPGAGKTHLLHAIGLSVQKNQPNLKVVYSTGETFTYEYMSALREHTIEEFRQRHRNVDVWLLDDVQFLVGKERTGEEFIHIYNTLYDREQQIVLSSDKAPKDLDLNPSLLSRFECGMIANIAPPDLETRVKIIQGKAVRENMALPNDVSLLLAKIVKGDVRQLEVALAKLQAYAALVNTPITLKLAEDVIGIHSIDIDKSPTLDPQLVQLIAARYFGIDVDELRGTGQDKEILVARQVAMYLSKQLTNSSFPMIGRAFGVKDYATVVHSIQNVQKLLETDAQLQERIKQISAELIGGGRSEPPE